MRLLVYWCWYIFYKKVLHCTRAVHYIKSLHRWTGVNSELVTCSEAGARIKSWCDVRQRESVFILSVSWIRTRGVWLASCCGLTPFYSPHESTNWLRFISPALLQHPDCHRIRCSLVHALNYPHYICRLRTVVPEAGYIINTPLSFRSPAKCWYHSTVSSMSGWFVNETALTRRLKGKKLHELPLDTHCPTNYYGSHKFPTSWPMTSLSINSALTLRVLM